MKIHTMEQRTEEWFDLRKGRITGTSMARIITAGGGVSTQRTAELCRCAAEYLGEQEPEFIPPTYWMERGVELEPEARGWFQVETGLTVQQCGFISGGEHTGFSPDGYVADPHMKEPDGDIDFNIIPVELKCPKPSTHFISMVDQDVPKQYKQQCHLQMVVSGAPYMYFMSYHPKYPSVIVKLERDDYTAKVEKALHSAAVDLEQLIADLQEKCNG